MYSLIPALVSGMFIAFGVYVLAAKGLNRVTVSFFLLCMTTFFWQGTWAILFTVQEASLADSLIRFGYVLITFVPTTLYHFLSEVSRQPGELRWVCASYGIAGTFALLCITTDLFISGHYRYEWGFYPRAGPVHPLHILQTGMVVTRGLWITWQQAKVCAPDQRARLRLCGYSMLCYFVAAVDYLCNYGADFYPPGVLFISIGLGMMCVAVARHDLMATYQAAATIAHEMRTPLAIIRMQAAHAAAQIPRLSGGINPVQSMLSRSHPDNQQEAICGGELLATQQTLALMCSKIVQQVDRTNQMIDLILASARMNQLDQHDFAWHAMHECVAQTLEAYPFTLEERGKVHLSVDADFEFYGSSTLLRAALSNLIKNSLYAMKAAQKGEIHIRLCVRANEGELSITDTASGIPQAVMAHIFDAYYSTKKSAGVGMGLAFCRRVIYSFGGQIRCSSAEGEYTCFSITLPIHQARSQQPKRSDSWSAP